MNRRVQLKPAPVSGAMIIVPDEVLDFFNWKVGMYLRLEVAEDGHLRLVRYHRREEEKC